MVIEHCQSGLTVNMETKVLSAVLHGKNDLRVEEFTLRALKSDEVRIKVQNCGICGSDTSMLNDGTEGFGPVVIGHEFSGVITDVGSDVIHLKPGDRVTVDPLDSCGNCGRCRSGHPNVCTHLSMWGFPPMHGGMARLTNIPARNVYKLPDDVDFEEGALTEPLAVCLQAVQRADVKAGDSVVIFGAGPIGLLMSQAALVRGATVVCVTDVKKSRLDLAREMGATHTVLFSQYETDARANAQKLRDALGEDIDISIDCTGQPVCLQTAVYATRSAGVVVLVGLGASDVSLPVMDAAIREIDIRGCLCHIFNVTAAMKLIASKRAIVKPVITQRFRLEDVPQAFELLRKRQVVKAMIQCSE